MCLRQLKKIKEYKHLCKMTEELPIIIVPARLASVRFPRKSLQEVNGIPLIIHTARRLVDVAPEFDILFADLPDALKNNKNFKYRFNYFPKKSNPLLPSFSENGKSLRKHRSHTRTYSAYSLQFRRLMVNYPLI